MPQTDIFNVRDDVREYVNANAYFVGAGRFQLLQDLANRVRSDSKNMCVVSGPEGIGKTTVLNQLRNDLSSEACCVLLQGHFDSMESVLDLLSRQLGVIYEDKFSLDKRLTLIHESINGAADAGPLLLLFDDAHALPLTLVRRLATWTREQRSPVRIVLAMDNEVVNGLDELIEHQSIESFAIRRVARSELADYLEHRYGPEVKFDELELSTIHQASEGVPQRINRQAGYMSKKRVSSSPLDIPTLDLPTPARRDVSNIAFNDEPVYNNGIESPFSPSTSAKTHDAASAFAIALSAAACLTVAVALLTLTTDFNEPTSDSFAAAASLPHFTVDTDQQAATVADMMNTEMTDTATISNDEQIELAYNDSNDSGYAVGSELAQQNLMPAVFDGAVPNDLINEPLIDPRPRISSGSKNSLSEDERDLMKIEPEQFVLQFIAGSSKAGVSKFVSQHRKLGVKMFTGTSKGKPVYKAVSAGFASVESAGKLIEQLPWDLRKDKPWIRSVASVQKEIRRSEKRSKRDFMPAGSQLAATL